MKIQEFKFRRDWWLCSHQPFHLRNSCIYLAYTVLFMILKCLCQRTLLKRSQPLQFQTWFQDHLEDHECTSLCHLLNKHLVLKVKHEWGHRASLFVPSGEKQQSFPIEVELLERSQKVTQGLISFPALSCSTQTVIYRLRAMLDNASLQMIHWGYYYCISWS